MIMTTRARYWRLALPLAVLLLTFCLGTAAPAPADEPACGGLDSSERVCAQSGASTPVLAVVHERLAVLTLDFPGSPVLPDGPPAEPVQHHADLATPRAPPSLT
jgi:hypothetical protein